MQYVLCHGVSYKEVGESFLAYSAQSAETILLHQYTFQILKCLSRPFSYLELLEILTQESSSDNCDIDLDIFLRNTLHELVDRGFIKLLD